MKRYCRILMIIAFAIFIIGTSLDADATLILRISDGIDILRIEDEDFGPTSPNTDRDMFPGAGTVMFSGSLSNFTVVVSVATSKPIIGPGNLDLFNINVTGANGGILTVEATDTGYVDPVLHPTLKLDIGGTTDGTMSVDSFFDLNNAPFGTTYTGPSLGPFGPGAFSDSGSREIPSTGIPYSLTIKGTITHSNPLDVTSFDANLHVSPEPTTLLLLGFGFVGLAAYGWRKKKQSEN